MKLGVWTAAWVLAACAWSGAAEAQEQPARAPAAAAERPLAQLDYVRERGAAACPDEEAVRRGVAVALGYDPFIVGEGGEERGAARIRCSLSRARGGDWRARIKVLDGDGKVIGERRLSSQAGDCAELASAVELAITIAIDPLFVAPPEPMPEPEPEPEPAPPPAAGEPASARAEPAPEDDSAADIDDEAPPFTGAALPREDAGDRPEVTGVTARPGASPWRWSMSVGALAALGAQPGVATGFSLGASVRRDSFSVHIEGRRHGATSQPAEGGTVSVSLMTAGVAFCWHMTSSSAGCVLGAGGALFGRGDFDVDGAATLPWVALGVRQIVEMPFASWFGLRVTGELFAPMTPTSLMVSGDPVWETPTVAGSLGLSAVGYFP